MTTLLCHLRKSQFQLAVKFVLVMVLMLTTSALGLDKKYTVIGCNDGDTCRVHDDKNQEKKVRLVGIDAPEVAKKKGRHPGRKELHGQPLGLAAKEKLNTMLKGKQVQLHEFGTDIYKRELAEIYLERLNVNVKMVEDGFAEVYRGKPPQGLHLESYQRAEQQAKAAKRGIWSIEDYESPKAFRSKNR